MKIDTKAAVEMMIQAAGPSPVARVEAHMAVQKKVMDTVENVTHMLLASLDPNRGQNVDLRA